MTIDHRAWVRGDAEALAAGRRALEAAGAFRDGATDLRAAVMLWQKRHGLTPSGYLGPHELAQLLEGATDEDETVPQRAADDTTEGDDHADR